MQGNINMFKEKITIDPFNWAKRQCEIYKEEWLKNHDDEAISLFELGEAFNDDEAHPEKLDPLKAKKYYQLASDLGFAPAMDKLANLIEESDPDLALELASQAMKSNYLPAHSTLAQWYQDGVVVDPDFEKSLQHFEICATNNDPISQWHMGLLLDSVFGKSREAETWFMRSLMGGYYLAWQYLGEMYYHGRCGQFGDFPQDYYLAFECFKQAYLHQQDWYPVSLKNIAECYLYGRGVVQDKNLALAMYQEAINQNDSWACHDLARIYLEGEFVPMDVEKAICLFEKGAELENDDCMNELADIYRWGPSNEGTDTDFIDFAKAIKWYQRGAELGNEDCISALEQYEKGEW